MKKLLRKILNQKQIIFLHSQKLRFIESMGRIAAYVVNLLPLRAQTILLSKINLTDYLDYPKAKIKLHIANLWDLYRLSSCVKEPETVQWIEDNLQPGDVFFDVGANVGAYSLVAHAATNGQANVFAFEPSFSTFSRLCENIYLNGYGNQIFPLQIALSDRTEIAQFSYTDLSAGSSMHWVTQNKDNQPIQPTVFKQPIITYSLDDLVEQFGLALPNLIKLDVDGSELNILKGANKVIKNPELRSILVETCVSGSREVDPVTEFLEKNGFYVRAKYQRGPENTYNVVFFRK